jgi:hypothetical protein
MNVTFFPFGWASNLNSQCAVDKCLALYLRGSAPTENIGDT